VAALVSINGGVPEDVLGRAHELLRIFLAQGSNMVINVGNFLLCQLVCKLVVRNERGFAHELFFQRYLLQFHPVHTSKSRAGKASGRKYDGFHTCCELQTKRTMSSRECSPKSCADDGSLLSVSGGCTTMTRAAQSRRQRPARRKAKPAAKASPCQSAPARATLTSTFLHAVSSA
jgi:hypothetical protein